MATRKPIKVVNENDWYLIHMPRIVKGTRLLWRTACRTFVPVEVISGQQNLQVKDLSTGEGGGKTFGLYIELIVEMEFPEEIIRLDVPLTSVRTR
jgi:hypothetical protein